MEVIIIAVNNNGRYGSRLWVKSFLSHNTHLWDSCCHHLAYPGKPLRPREESLLPQGEPSSAGLGPWPPNPLFWGLRHIWRSLNQQALRGILFPDSTSRPPSETGAVEGGTLQVFRTATKPASYHWALQMPCGETLRWPPCAKGRPFPYPLSWKQGWPGMPPSPAELPSHPSIVPQTLLRLPPGSDLEIAGRLMGKPRALSRGSPGPFSSFLDAHSLCILPSVISSPNSGAAMSVERSACSGHHLDLWVLGREGSGISNEMNSNTTST